MSVSSVNPAGADWLLMRSRLFTEIADAHKRMEGGLTPEEYHAERGSIALARRVIEWVEPSGPPTTTEDSYDISDPSQGNYA